MPCDEPLELSAVLEDRVLTREGRWADGRGMELGGVQIQDPLAHPRHAWPGHEGSVWEELVAGRRVTARRVVDVVAGSMMTSFDLNGAGVSRQG